MSSVIEELYYGNIDPNGGIYPQDSPFVKAAHRKLDAMDELRESLDAAQRKWFEQYCDAQEEIDRIKQYHLFEYGLKFGVRLSAEVFQEEENPDDQPSYG